MPRSNPYMTTGIVYFYNQFMITYYYKSLKNTKLRTVDSYRKGALTVVTQATQEDLLQIADLTNLQTNDLKDIFDYQEIPRLEIVDGVHIVVLREPIANQTTQHTQVIMLILAKSNLFIISPSENSIALSWANKDRITTQTTKLLISFLIAISEQYRLNINNLQRQVFEVKSRLHQATNADIQKLIEHQNILDEYLSALQPMQQIYATLVSGKVIQLYEEDNALFEDSLNSITQSADVCRTNLKSIEGLRDAFQIIFTNRLNETVKFLTSATIILTIPTIVASLFGMNVTLPFNDHPAAFLLVLGIATSISVGLTLFFRQKKWF